MEGRRGSGGSKMIDRWRWPITGKHGRRRKGEERGWQQQCFGMNDGNDVISLIGQPYYPGITAPTFPSSLRRFLFSLSRQGPSRIGREIKYEIWSRIVFPFFVEFNLTATVKRSRIEKWGEGTRLDLEKKFWAASPGIVSRRMWKWNFWSIAFYRTFHRL